MDTSTRCGHSDWDYCPPPLYKRASTQHSWWTLHHLSPLLSLPSPTPYSVAAASKIYTIHIWCDINVCVLCQQCGHQTELGSSSSVTLAGISPMFYWVCSTVKMYLKSSTLFCPQSLSSEAPPRILKHLEVTGGLYQTLLVCCIGNGERQNTARECYWGHSKTWSRLRCLTHKSAFKISEPHWSCYCFPYSSINY